MGGMDHTVIMADNSEIQKLKQELKQSSFEHNSQINELQNMLADQKLRNEVVMQEKDNTILELTDKLQSARDKENIKP